MNASVLVPEVAVLVLENNISEASVLLLDSTADCALFREKYFDGLAVVMATSCRFATYHQYDVPVELEDANVDIYIPYEVPLLFISPKARPYALPLPTLRKGILIAVAVLDD